MRVIPVPVQVSKKASSNYLKYRYDSGYGTSARGIKCRAADLKFAGLEAI